MFTTTKTIAAAALLAATALTPAAHAADRFATLDALPAGAVAALSATEMQAVEGKELTLQQMMMLMMFGMMQQQQQQTLVPVQTYTQPTQAYSPPAQTTCLSGTYCSSTAYGTPWTANPTSSIGGYIASAMDPTYYYNNQNQIKATFQKQATMLSQGMSNSPYSPAYSFHPLLNSITQATIAPGYAPFAQPMPVNQAFNDPFFNGMLINVGMAGRKMPLNGMSNF